MWGEELEKTRGDKEVYGGIKRVGERKECFLISKKTGRASDLESEGE